MASNYPYESDLSRGESVIAHRYADVIDRVGRLVAAVEYGQWAWVEAISGALQHALRRLASAIDEAQPGDDRASDVADVAVIGARQLEAGRRLHPPEPYDDATVMALVRAAVARAPADSSPGPVPQPSQPQAPA